MTRLVKRLQSFVACVFYHTEIGGILEKASARSGDRRRVPQEQEDIKQSAWLAMWEFIQTDPPCVKQPFSPRFSAWFFTEGYLLEVSNQNPLPREVHDAIGDLCDNVAPRQSHLTPRQFCEDEDRDVVQQGDRRKRATLVKLNSEPLTVDVEEPLMVLIAEEETLMAQENRRRFWDAADCVLDDREHDIVAARWDGWGLAEIGERIGVSAARVHQILTKALKKIRHAITE